MLWRIYTWNWYAIKPVCFLNEMSTVYLWAMKMIKWKDNTPSVLAIIIYYLGKAEAYCFPYSHIHLIHWTFNKRKVMKTTINCSPTALALSNSLSLNYTSEINMAVRL